MDRKKLLEFASKALLLLEGIVLGVICMLMFFFFSEAGALILIAATLILLLGMYVVLKYRYTWLAHYNCNRVIGVLKQMKLSKEDEIRVEDGAYSEVFRELEELRKIFVQEEKLRKNILNIVDSVAINMDLQIMLEDMLPKIINITDSNCGAFYLFNEYTNKLELKYSLGFNKNIYNEFDINLGEGLIGEIAKNKKIKIVEDIPHDTVYIARTFLGNIKPNNLMVVPIVNGDKLTGTLVLASVKRYSDELEEQASLIRYYLGIAVGNGITYETNKRLANELKFQNKLIQDFNTELENKVMERSLLYDNVINSIQEYAIYSMDKEGFITTWNLAAGNLMGYSQEEVIGQHVSLIYASEKDPVAWVNSKLKEVVRYGRYQEFIWRYKKDGSRYYADVNLFGIYNNNKELIGFTNVTRDITGIISMEQSLVSERAFSYKLLSMTDQSVIIIDSGGEIKFVNQSAVKKNNISAEKFTDTAFSDLFEAKEEVNRLIDEVIKNKHFGQLSQVKLLTAHKACQLSLYYIQEELKDISMVALITEIE